MTRLRGGTKFGLSSVALVALLASTAPASAQSSSGNRWGYGAELGVLTETVDGTAFNLGFQAERYLAPTFSMGPRLLLTPTGDLTAFSGAWQIRFHFDTGDIAVSPFVGIGLIYVKAEKIIESETVKSDGAAIVFPLGLALEVPFDDNLTLGGSLTFQLHRLDFDDRIGEDNASVALMLGINYHP